MVYCMNILFRSMEQPLKNVEPAGPFVYGPDPFPVSRPLYSYGSPYKFAPCTVCKIRFNENFRHKHHSSIYFQENSMRLYGPTVNCPTCKVQHNYEIGSRTTVLFTTSTLHNVFLDPGFRLPFHLEIESICGGRTVELYQAWKAGYSNVNKPQDVIVLSGLNDVVIQHNAGGEAIGFYNLLKLWDHEVKQKNPTSTFRACRILRPPKLCWFPANQAFPTADYTNYIETVEHMNAKIDKLNKDNGEFLVPGFQMEGCRAGRRKRRVDGVMVPSIRHSFSSWREAGQGREKCLHLTDSKRLAMFGRLCRYIENNIIN